MSAAELRRAAETLRGRATASAKVSPAPWSGGKPRDCHCCDGPPLVDANGEAIVDAWQMQLADAEYVRAMHPGVGLALADVLDALADEIPNDTYPREGSAARRLVDLINRSSDSAGANGGTA